MRHPCSPPDPFASASPEQLQGYQHWQPWLHESCNVAQSAQLSSLDPQHHTLLTSSHGEAESAQTRANKKLTAYQHRIAMLYLRSQENVPGCQVNPSSPFLCFAYTGLSPGCNPFFSCRNTGLSCQGSHTALTRRFCLLKSGMTPKQRITVHPLPVNTSIYVRAQRRGQMIRKKVIKSCVQKISCIRLVC